jgi:pyridoxine 4-dehydrogenase
MKKNHESHKLSLSKNTIVNRIGYGAMRITGKDIWGEPSDRNEVIAVLRRAIELGINFIDTADVYGPYISEILIAEALYPYPDDLVIATKGGLMRPGSKQWIANGDPKHLRAACEGSLKRLKLEQIILYQLHRIDANVPLTDQIGVLQDLQTEGKIKHIGLSEVSLEELKLIKTLVPVTSVQNKFNLLQRQSEDVLEYCTRENIVFIPWAPLTVGQFAYPGSVLELMAKKIGAKPMQVILAWLLQKSSCMLPIPGTTNLLHLEENAKSAFLTLDDDIINTLDTIENIE